MEIRSILVNVGLGSSHLAPTYAVRLAQEHGAEIIGLAAAEPHYAYVGADGTQLAVDYYAAERKNIEVMLERAEDRFRQVVAGSVPMKWRSYIANTTEMLIDQARCCDIVVASAEDSAGANEVLDPGHLILAGGRPVIMVGDGTKGFASEKVAIAWKDTREARRAVADALPILKRAKQVKLVSRSEGDISAEAASLSGVVEWLGQHGVQCETQLVEQGAEFDDALGLLSHEGAPDLLVLGGYGHSRVREWLFGGVTRDLLGANSVNRLFSY